MPAFSAVHKFQTNQLIAKLLAEKQQLGEECSSLEHAPKSTTNFIQMTKANMHLTFNEHDASSPASDLTPQSTTTISTCISDRFEVQQSSQLPDLECAGNCSDDYSLYAHVDGKQPVDNGGFSKTCKDASQDILRPEDTHVFVGDLNEDDLCRFSSLKVAKEVPPVFFTFDMEKLPVELSSEQIEMVVVSPSNTFSAHHTEHSQSYEEKSEDVDCKRYHDKTFNHFVSQDHEIVRSTSNSVED